MSLILSWLILSLAVWVTDALLPGVHPLCSAPRSKREVRRWHGIAADARASSG